MNVSKTKLRASICPYMLNKSMKVALGQFPFNAEDLLDLLVLITEKAEASVLGEVRIDAF